MRYSHHTVSFLKKHNKKIATMNGKIKQITSMIYVLKITMQRYNKNRAKQTISTNYLYKNVK